MSSAQINTLLLQLIVVTLTQLDFTHETLLQVMLSEHGIYKLLYINDLFTYALSSDFLTPYQLSVLEPKLQTLYSFLETDEYKEAYEGRNKFARK